MSKLYQDALADAKKLREIAEQNAKNKIIEAVAPRIKQLIENELMNDDSDSIEFFNSPTEELASGSDVQAEMAADDLVSDDGANLPSMEDPVEPMELDLEPISLDLGSDPVETAPTEFSFEKDGKQVKVSVTVEGKDKRASNNIRNLPVSKLISLLREAKNDTQRKLILKEISKIRKKLIIMSEAGDKPSRTKLKALNLLLKENKSMRRKNKTGQKLTEMWWLNEEDEEVAAEEVETEETEEAPEVEESDVDVAAIKDAVASLADALNMEVEETEVETDDDDDVEDDDDDEEFELDLGEVDETYMKEDEDETYMKENEDEMADKDADETAMKEDEDEGMVMEISESMLRREIAKMNRSQRRSSRRSGSSRLSESRRRRMARRRRLAEMGDPVAAMHSAADEVIEVTEEDLINALAAELGKQDDAGMSVDGIGNAAGQTDSFGGASAGSEALSERRRTRRAQIQLKEARKQAKLLKREAAAAKKELKESNLFNAKLLYVNKLMQSYNLNVKQQRAIVEALDNAKTLREAKLLYTTLTESLKKGRSTKGGTMNESASRTGSASKSVRSSAPAKNGTELGRWAVLAGLNKK